MGLVDREMASLAHLEQVRTAGFAEEFPHLIVRRNAGRQTLERAEWPLLVPAFFLDLPWQGLDVVEGGRVRIKMRVCAKAIERVDFRRAKFGVVEVQREGCGGRPLDFLVIALDHADDVGQITAE